MEKMYLKNDFFWLKWNKFKRNLCIHSRDLIILFILSLWNFLFKESNKINIFCVKNNIFWVRIFKNFIFKIEPFNLNRSNVLNSWKQLTSFLWSIICNLHAKSRFFLRILIVRTFTTKTKRKHDQCFLYMD